MKINIRQATYLMIGLTTLFFQEIYAQKTNLVSAKQVSTGTYGFKEEGKEDWVILPTYQLAYSFYDRVAIVKKGGLYFAINLHEEQLSPKFKDMEPALVGYLAKNDEEFYTLYDLSFHPIPGPKILSTQYVGSALAQLYRTREDGDERMGVINAQGNLLVPPIYKKLETVLQHSSTIKLYDSLPAEILEGYNFGFFLLAQDVKNHWGLIDLTGEELIPFKYRSTNDLIDKGGRKYAATIKARIDSGIVKQVQEQCKQAYNLMLSKSADYIAALPEEAQHLSPMVITPVEGGFSLQRDGKSIDGICYTSVIEEDSLYMLEHNERYGLIDRWGQTVLPTEFEALLPWGEANGRSIYLALRDDQYQLYDTQGKALLQKSYEAISSCVAGYAYVMDKQGFKLIDGAGRYLNEHYYEDIEIMPDGTITATRLGYQTTLDAEGKERPSIASQLFDKAYNDTDATRQIETYQLAIEADLDNEEGIQAKALNNIGYIHEQKGHLETALAFYDQAKDKGNSLAQNNASRLRSEIRKARIDGVVNALNQMSQALGANANATQGTTWQAADYTGTPSGSGSGRSFDYYQNNYNRWEKVARMAYESLTNTGYRTTDKNGKAKGGSSAGSFSTANYTSLKRNLRNAQKEMRECRREARRDGHTIAESEYETVTTSF